MEFKIQPKTVTATKLIVNPIGQTSSGGVEVYYELRNDTLKEPIDKGNWTLPKSAYNLLATLEITEDGYVLDETMKAAINEILSQPRIEMVLADQPTQ